MLKRGDRVRLNDGRRWPISGTVVAASETEVKVILDGALAYTYYPQYSEAIEKAS